jgi:putative transposase
MLVFEFKAYGKSAQLTAVDDAIRTAKFIRNSCIRLWMDVKGTGKNDLQKYCAVLAANFPFANELNSMARDLPAQNEHGLLFLGSMRTARKVLLGRKVFPNTKRIAVRLNIKHQDGNSRITASL